MNRGFLSTAIWLAGSLLAGAAFGETPVVRVPTAGFVFDGGYLREISGARGAWTLSAGGVRASRATVAPEANIAIVMDPESGVATLVRNGAGTSLTLGAASLAAISPSGSSAALYDESRQTISVFRSLGISPQYAWRTDLPLGEAPRMLAVSDAGDAVLAGFASGAGAAVREYPADGGSSELWRGAAIGAMTFLRGSRDAAIADSVENTVTLTGSRARLLAGSGQGVARPAGIAATGEWLLIANAGDSSVLRIALDGSGATVSRCGCAVSSLEPAGPGLFLLSRKPGAPAWVYDASSARAWFVPRADAAVAAAPRRGRGGFGSLRVRRQADPGLSIEAPALAPARQLPVAVRIGQPAPADLQGALDLAPLGAEDSAIQFSTGGRSARFVIQAGATQAEFAGGGLLLQAGSGATPLSLRATLESGGATASATLLAAGGPPEVTRIQITSTDGSPITGAANQYMVRVFGVAAAPDIATAVFKFTPASPGRLASTDFQLSVEQQFRAFFASPAGASGAFELDVPFSVQGSLADIGGGTVFLKTAGGLQSNTMSTTLDWTALAGVFQ